MVWHAKATVAIAMALILIVSSSFASSANELKPNKDDINTILHTHNKYRKLHHSPPLVWNNALALYAQNVSSTCIFKHSNGPYGENLAGRTKGWQESITAWYDEISLYNFSNPGFDHETGHFTQVIWKATKSVGCGATSCPDFEGTIFVCEYSPRGNVILKSDHGKRFKENVIPSS